VKETAVRYPGTHEFGALPSLVGTPAGWLGYWMKYNAGTSAASVSVEAGLGAGAPSYTSVGTISYWNGTGYTSVAPSATGGAIPICPLAYNSPSGYLVEISAGAGCPATSSTLGSAPSSAITVPGAAGATAEARATLGAPVAGTFTYKITNTTPNPDVVICDLTVAVDLGSLTAMARYAP
jgi:hypothetical protein